MIDPHVHLRDWNQAGKETLRHAFDLAWRIGISGLFEMPNTDPPLTDPAAITQRIAEADSIVEELNVPLFHGIYAGLTADPEQIASIVEAHRTLFPRLVGCKLYAGHSTGQMGVITESEQRLVWETLAALEYRGVVAVHAETEDLLRPDLWDPGNPISHGLARPPAAEAHSIARQVRLAGEAGFAGSIHICHISTPEGLGTVTRSRSGVLPYTLRVGVTPHHVLLNEEVARRSSVPEWRVNPPLRDEQRRRALRARLEAGEIDWIESDHAPHTWQDKLEGAAGLPGIPAFRLLKEKLSARIGHEQTSRLTHTAVLDAFGIDLPTRNPRAELPWDYEDIAREYPWDPYRFLEAR